MPTLDWIGKNKVINHHQEVPYRILVRQYSFDENGQHAEDNGSPNMIIHGDNLEALKSLLPRYEGRIKCIYIDPPYNTGIEKWIYNDNVNDPKIRKWLGEVVGKEGEDLSRHDKWLCMMYPRLMLLYKLLAEDGVIFISIDDNEQADLKLLCDEIFGSRNFVANIVWKKKTNGNNMGHIPPVHDFVVVYAKNTELLNMPGIPQSEEFIDNTYRNPDNDPRGPWTTSDLSANHEGPHFPIVNPKNGKVYLPPVGRYWVFNEEEVKRRIEDGRIIFGKKGESAPVQKVFAADRVLVNKPETWFDSQGYNSDGMVILKNMFGKKVFDHPKPPSLVEYIISFASSPGDIVLDSFAGSGTTGHALLNINAQQEVARQFILIEQEEYAEEITAERLKKVIVGYSSHGKEVTQIFSKKLTINDLKSGKILELAIAKKEDLLPLYDEIKGPVIKDGKLIVEGVTNKESVIPGIGGNFSFYELGAPLLTPEGYLNEAVGVERIREYMWYMETRSDLPKEGNGNPHYLGTSNSTSYYFYYQPGESTALDYDFLETIPERTESIVIYADRCHLSEKELTRFGITFKKIPRDITKL